MVRDKEDDMMPSTARHLASWVSGSLPGHLTQSDHPLPGSTVETAGRCETPTTLVISVFNLS